LTNPQSAELMVFQKLTERCTAHAQHNHRWKLEDEQRRRADE